MFGSYRTLRRYLNAAYKNESLKGTRNIPAHNEPSWKIFLRRLELMFWAVIGPEFIISWAFRQWTGARELEKRYNGNQVKCIQFIRKY